MRSGSQQHVLAVPSYGDAVCEKRLLKENVLKIADTTGYALLWATFAGTECAGFPGKLPTKH